MAIASTTARAKGGTAPGVETQALRCVITRHCPYDWDALEAFAAEIVRKG